MVISLSAGYFNPSCFRADQPKQNGDKLSEGEEYSIDIPFTATLEEGKEYPIISLLLQSTKPKWWNRSAGPEHFPIRRRPAEIQFSLYCTA
jgi:hypothetical protein